MRPVIFKIFSSFIKMNETTFLFNAYPMDEIGKNKRMLDWTQFLTC